MFSLKTKMLLFSLFSLLISTILAISSRESDKNLKFPNHGYKGTLQSSTESRNVIVVTEHFLQNLPSNAHKIVKRNAQNKSHRRSRRRKSKRPRKNRFWEMKGFDTFDLHNNVLPPDKDVKSESSAATGGSLLAHALKAGRIDVTSFTADKIVADTVRAHRIEGDVVTVTAKFEPLLSEFVHDTWTGWHSSRQDKTKRSHNLRRHSESSFDDKKSRQINRAGRHRRQSSTSNRRPHKRIKTYDGYRRKRTSYHRRQKSYYPDTFWDGDIIDTSNHPFIAFQNGFVKRQRIHRSDRKSKRNKGTYRESSLM